MLGTNIVYRCIWASAVLVGALIVGKTIEYVSSTMNTLFDCQHSHELRACMKMIVHLCTTQSMEKKRFKMNSKHT